MRIPDNWHAHFRQGETLAFLTQAFIENGWRGRIVAMPNTQPPKLTGLEAMDYRDEISYLGRGVFGSAEFTPVPVIQITEQTTPEVVHRAARLGVVAGKFYPYFVTTNSENGIKNYEKVYPALVAMQEQGMVAQFHPEDPSHDVEGLEKEKSFIAILDRIVRRFPRLRIVVEHVTSAAAVEWVNAQSPNVAATVTAHHLFNTVDDVLGYSERSCGKMRVHDGCKPQAKHRADRDALRRVVLYGNQKFFYGGDDAFHTKDSKEKEGSCGVWNTISAIPLLIELFSEAGVLEKLEPFLSVYGARFYRVQLNRGTVSFARSRWAVPKTVESPGGEGVPYYYGQELEWKIE